jgi:eukaryotic-like serine/threonine-protein kinase
MLCDNTEEYATAAALVEEALATRPAILPPALEARLGNRLGVVRSRQQRVEEAIEHLNMAQLLAEATGDHATRIGSLLLSSRLLSRSGRGVEGERLLDDAIDLCERVGDHFHLVNGLLNRHNQRYEQNRLVEARDDAERGLAIAREMGFHQLEIWLTFNLCITIWWAGNMDEALRLAQRAHELGLERFRDQPNITGTIQYALVLVVSGRIEEARGLLERVRRSKLADSVYEPTLHLLELAVGERNAGEWDRVIDTILEDAQPQEAVETMWVRARAALRDGDMDLGRSYLDRARAEAERRGGGVARAIAAQIDELIAAGPVATTG